MIMNLEKAKERYGEIKNGHWADEAKWCALHTPPLALTWINTATGKRVEHIYINQDMIGPLDRALKNVIDRGLVDELKTFDGCFMVRDVRGEPGHLSCHCYALAIDINAAENQLGQEPKMSPELVKCFTDVGFAWGGNFHRKDGMHFSFAWE